MAFCCTGYLLCWCEVVQSIQGLVLLGNQWLLFVVLGGFANNAFFMSHSACMSANVPSQFLLVCCFVVGVLVWVWIWVGEHNPLIVCHVHEDPFCIRYM